jgi:hypothetical protein
MYSQAPPAEIAHRHNDRATSNHIGHWLAVPLPSQ